RCRAPVAQGTPARRPGMIGSKWLEADRRAWGRVLAKRAQQIKKEQRQRDGRVMILKVTEDDKQSSGRPEVSTVEHKSEFEQSQEQNLTRRAAEMQRDEVNARLDTLARMYRKDNETFEAAYARILDTEEGRQL